MGVLVLGGSSSGVVNHPTTTRVVKFGAANRGSAKGLPTSSHKVVMNVVCGYK